jgi:hypothetical protein
MRVFLIGLHHQQAIVTFRHPLVAKLLSIGSHEFLPYNSVLFVTRALIQYGILKSRRLSTTSPVEKPFQLHRTPLNDEIDEPLVDIVAVRDR